MAGQKLDFCVRIVKGRRGRSSEQIKYFPNPFSIKLIRNFRELLLYQTLFKVIAFLASSFDSRL
jgi:hypothetical protein